MKDLNEAFVHLNVGLPDDVERLKAAGYYKEAMARIDEYLAEDWTETQNSPRSQGLEMPEYEQPANPVPSEVHSSTISCAVCRRNIAGTRHRPWPGCRALCGISR